MPTADPPDKRSLWWLWLVTGGLLLLTMPRFLYVGDPITIRATTINLLRQGDLSAPPEVATRFGERGQHFYEHPGNQRWFSKYGVLNALAYIPPLAVEAFLSGELRHFHQLSDSQLATRGLLLNLWNIVLSLILATYLYYLARLHGGNPRAAWWFVLLALFGTFLWHYLRAQTVEIFQVLLFTAAYYHCVRFTDRWREGVGRPALQASAAIGLLGLLSLAKTVYIVLLPLGLLLVAVYALTVPRAAYNAPPEGTETSEPPGDERRAARALLPGPLLVALSACLLLAFSNWYRFGSPWNNGYQQFAVERTLFHWSAEGFVGYLVDPQKSLLLYFPLLPLALLGVARTPGPRRATLAWAWLGFLLLYALNASFVNWRGDWCYGPRYLLFALPVLSLPAAAWLTADRPGRYVKGLVVAGLFAWSLWTINAPLAIHASEFFASFRARQLFAEPESEFIADKQVRSYFQRPHWQVNHDLQRFCLGTRDFPPLEQSSTGMPPEKLQATAAALRRIPLGNYYWAARLLGGSQTDAPATATADADSSRRAAYQPSASSPHKP